MFLAGPRDSFPHVRQGDARQFLDDTVSVDAVRLRELLALVSDHTGHLRVLQNPMRLRGDGPS